MKIVISNQGMVEPGAFTLLGASTKRDDKNKIGMFGSGNKYALAYFLRNGYQVRILSGEKEIKVGTITVEFQETTWEVICIDDHQTSITTETGPKWTLWQAVREIYSNALDEGEATIDFHKDNDAVIHHHIDRTTIMITPPKEKEDEFLEFLDNFDKYFLPQGTPFLYKGKNVEIYPGSDGTVYRKGIRAVSDERERSIFNYNLMMIDINESRLISDEREMKLKIWRAIIHCDVPMVIARFLQYIGDTTFFEHNEAVKPYWGKDPILSDTWRKILSRYKVCPSNLSGFLEVDEIPRTKFVPEAFYRLILEQMGPDVDALAKKRKNGVDFKEVKINKYQQEMLSDGVAWMTSAGVNIDYPIKVVHFHKDNVFGLAADDTIYISRKCFDKGQHFLCKVIFEEQAHLEHHVEDTTREMQNLYLDKIMSLMERIKPR